MIGHKGRTLNDSIKYLNPNVESHIELGNARKMWLALWALGAVAVLSLLLAPLELLQPAKMHLPALAFRALAMLNPMVMVATTVALGSWLAPKVGLDAPLLRALLNGRGAVPVLRRQLGPALVVGIITAGILVGYARFTAPYFVGARIPDLPMPLVTKLLYGGVTEELLTRWGLMSLSVWIAWRIVGCRLPVPNGCYIIGAAVASLLFSAGHLPVLFLISDHPASILIGAVLLGNFVPGFMFGALFWRRGLEAAMLAHGTAHLFFHFLAPGIQ